MEHQLIEQWIEREDYSLIKKITKLIGKKSFYKLCKDKHKETNNKFFIRSMRKIGLLYRIKAFFYKRKCKKINIKVQIQTPEKAQILNNILKNIAAPQKSVYIMQYSFYDYSGKNYYSGGGERYANDLAEIILNLGYTPIIIQCGEENAEKPWINRFNDKFNVIGINASFEEYFCIINAIDTPKLTIYSGVMPWRAEDSHKPSILISHGITWDHPFADADVFALKKLLNVADEFVSVDTNTISWFRSTFSKYIFDNKIKMNYIPNYVDLEKYTPNKNKENNSELKILYPRRCCNERGFFLFTEIIPKIFKKYKNISVDFVGYAHTDEVIKQLNKLQKSYPNRIKHYVLSAEEMNTAYKNADISLVPTLYCEGTSLSCIEAMASANAVIVTDIGGLPNLVINRYNGLLIEPDSESLYNAIEELIINENFRKELQENAHSVSKAFSKENWINNWTKIIQQYL